MIYVTPFTFVLATTCAQDCGQAALSQSCAATQAGYNDATSAAAAAKEYYLQAKLASEAAERWAQGDSKWIDSNH